MCQGAIINYLVRKKATKEKPVEINEFLANIPAQRRSISENCRKLRKSGGVKFQKKKEKSYEKYYYFL